MSNVDKIFRNGTPLDADDLNKMVEAINDNDHKLGAVGNATTPAELASVVAEQMNHDLYSNDIDELIENGVYYYDVDHGSYCTSGAPFDYATIWHTRDKRGISQQIASDNYGASWIRRKWASWSAWTRIDNFGATDATGLASVVADNISGTALETLKDKLKAIW